MAEPCLRHEVRGRGLLRRMLLPLTLTLSPRKSGERECAAQGSRQPGVSIGNLGEAPRSPGKFALGRSGPASCVDASVMIEKFAGVRGLVRSEFLDLNHTSKLMILVSLMISKFAPEPSVEHRRTSKSAR